MKAAKRAQGYSDGDDFKPRVDSMEMSKTKPTLMGFVKGPQRTKAMEKAKL
jgi:hypothetical protein